ncbi:MAG TPA: PspC domain-containing protein [Actinopolymorphaceae bacterium]|nr:PspC domain-containing protein [Actinopolymorphaceae bacterium]
MPTTPPTPPEGSDGGPSTGTGPDGVLGDLRALRRASDGRIIAGVCAGAGRRLGVDPVVLRVVLVVLALFGGVGLLLYAAGWLLMPSEGDQQSLLEQQLGRRRDGAPDGAVVIGGLVVLGLLVVSVPWWGFPWHVPFLLVLSVLGLVALVRRNAGEGDAAGPDGANPAASPGSHGYDPDVLDHLPAYPPDHALGEPGDDPEATTSWRTAVPAPSSFWDHPDPLGLEIEDPQLVPVPRPPRRRPVPTDRQSRLLLAGTLAAVLVVTGAMGLLGGDSIPAGGYVATALGVVGLGLIAGTWIGRTRILTAIGVVLALALIPVTAADQWPGGTVDATLRPTSVGEIRPSYHYGAGTLVLDLTQVDFASARPVATSIDLGAGEVKVLVPSDVDVQVNADISAGDLMAFRASEPPFLRTPRSPRITAPPPASTGPKTPAPPAAPTAPRTFEKPSFPEYQMDKEPGYESSGVDIKRQLTDLGTDGTGGGQLDLDIDLGIGSVEVQRVP